MIGHFTQIVHLTTLAELLIFPNRISFKRNKRSNMNQMPLWQNLLKNANLAATMGPSPWLSYSQRNAKSWCKWNILTKFMVDFAFKGSNKCAQHTSPLSLPAQIQLTQWERFWRGCKRKKQEYLIRASMLSPLASKENGKKLSCKYSLVIYQGKI